MRTWEKEKLTVRGVRICLETLLAELGADVEKGVQRFDELYDFRAKHTGRRGKGYAPSDAEIKAYERFLGDGNYDALYAMLAQAHEVPHGSNRGARIAALFGKLARWWGEHRGRDTEAVRVRRRMPAPRTLDGEIVKDSE